MVLLLLVIVAVTVGVIYVQEALRKIPIQYAKRVTGRGQTTAGQQTHLPLKVNAAGVIPVIFAVAFFITPQSIASFFGENNVTQRSLRNIRLYKPSWDGYLRWFNYCIYLFLRIHSGES